MSEIRLVLKSEAMGPLYDRHVVSAVEQTRFARPLNRSVSGRAYASRVPQNRAATKDFFEKMAVEGRCEPFLGDAQFLWMRLQQRQRQAA